MLHITLFLVQSLIEKYMSILCFREISKKCLYICNTGSCWETILLSITKISFIHDRSPVAYLKLSIALRVCKFPKAKNAPVFRTNIKTLARKLFYKYIVPTGVVFLGDISAIPYGNLQRNQHDHPHEIETH